MKPDVVMAGIVVSILGVRACNSKVFFGMIDYNKWPTIHVPDEGHQLDDIGSDAAQQDTAGVKDRMEVWLLIYPKLLITLAVVAHGSCHWYSV